MSFFAFSRLSVFVGEPDFRDERKIQSFSASFPRPSTDFYKPPFAVLYKLSVILKRAAGMVWISPDLMRTTWQGTSQHKFGSSCHWPQCSGLVWFLAACARQKLFPPATTVKPDMMPSAPQACQVPSGMLLWPPQGLGSGPTCKGGIGALATLQCRMFVLADAVVDPFILALLPPLPGEL